MGDVATAPILPSRDIDGTERFYAALGFATHLRTDDYLILRGHGIELHFFGFPDHDPRTCYAGAFVRHPDPDALHARFAPADLPSTGIPRLTAPEDKPWGVREFALVDPDGSLIRVGRALS
ncbi:MAG TPA: VOC family protein [Salinarimonas sp.]|jgi:catechol 2,3-dioxygenase-like lactoylglutathione lyase family enzyme|nr:VOC family protein [Salinarimonas sp.]